MNNRTTFVGSYSNKRHYSKASHSKSQSPEAPHLKTIRSKLKLPKISTQASKIPSTTTQESVIKHNSVLKPLEKNAKDYENAIKTHLGIINLSRDNSFSSLSPKFKQKSKVKPKEAQRSFDASNLSSIKHEETRISAAVQHNATFKHKPSETNDKYVEHDKEIQKIEESLNQINMKLNKILKKSSNKNK